MLLTGLGGHHHRGAACRLRHQTAVKGGEVTLYLGPAAGAVVHKADPVYGNGYRGLGDHGSMVTAQDLRIRHSTTPVPSTSGGSNDRSREPALGLCFSPIP